MLLKDAVTYQCFMLYETEKNLCFRMTCGYETTFNEESDVELFSDLSFREFLKFGDAFGFLEVGLITTFIETDWVIVHYHLRDVAYTDYVKEVQACNPLWGMKEKINQ
jgi:hypothetical protein